MYALDALTPSTSNCFPKPVSPHRANHFCLVASATPCASEKSVKSNVDLKDDTRKREVNRMEVSAAALATRRHCCFHFVHL